MASVQQQNWLVIDPTMEVKKTPLRRLQVLASHLQPSSSPLPNIRPGDADANSVDTSFFIKGPFAPRSDEKIIDYNLISSVVEGNVETLAELRGSFLRIGPNPHFDFQGKPYHVFDGDGMIHQLEFHGDGNLTYRNKFIRTEVFQQDERRNFSFSIMGEAASVLETGNMAWMQHARGEMGRANTALVSHHGKMLALFEQDVPYQIDHKTLATIGKSNEFGDLPFTAHPKVCPKTGEMIYFGYVNGRRAPAPSCHYGVVGSDGTILRSFHIKVPAPVMMHDIAITSTRSIFFDYNNRYHSPKEIMAGRAKSMYSVEKSLPARFGVLPRHAESDQDMVWINVPISVVFHFLNAWDVGENEIVVWGCAATSIDLDNLAGDEARTSGGVMTCWRLDVQTKSLVEMFTINNPTPNGVNTMKTAVDFAQLPASRVGMPMRYGYAAIFCAGFQVDGIAKYDLVARTTLSYRFEKGVFGGESIFVPRGQGGEGREDDGWLMCFVYGDQRCESALEVVDAKTMTQVARIAVPIRVPAGFHACWRPSV